MEDERQGIVDKNIRELKADVLSTTNELKLIKESCNNLDQYSRRHWVEIREIPPARGTTSGNTNGIVVRVGEAIVFHQQDLPQSPSLTCKICVTGCERVFLSCLKK